jgi:catechol 2,3-dioxygenase-like lactoylglutathione lyase family enzyme
MPVELNHTIVYSRNKSESAKFLAYILGLAEPKRFGPFLTVQVDNGVTLDFMDDDRAVPPAHYAFLISETDFDQAFERIKAYGVRYWADPMHTRPNSINHGDGGRGLYFEDPDGHNMEIITRPYGGV